MTKPDKTLTLIAEYHRLIVLHQWLDRLQPPLQKEGGELARELPARWAEIYDQVAGTPATTFEGLAAQIRFLGTEDPCATLKEHAGIILRGLDALANEPGD